MNKYKEALVEVLAWILTILLFVGIYKLIKSL